MYEHWIRCAGGPLAGHGYVLDGKHPVPPMSITISGPDGTRHHYMRLTHGRPIQAGDAWEYVPALPGDDLHGGPSAE